MSPHSVVLPCVALVALVALGACATATPPAATAAAPSRAAADSARFEHFITSYLAAPRGRRGRGTADPLARLRADAELDAARRASTQLAELRGVDTTQLSVPQRIDWLLLQSALERTVHDTVLHAAENTPARYLTLGNLYFRVLGQRPPTPTDWIAVRGDLRTAPRAMALGRQQLRTPPPLWITLAVNTANSYARFLRGDFAERVRTAAPDSLRPSLLAASDSAATALDAYTAFLCDTLRAGSATSWASGREYYDWVLRNVDFLPYGADTMIAGGRAIHAATRLALDSVAWQIRPGTPWRTLADEMRTRHPEPGQILAAYETASHHVQAFLLHDNLVYLPPNQELVFVPTPPELRETYAWGGYGGIMSRDSIHVGQFFVTDVVPGMTPAQVSEKLRTQNDGWIEVIALHEGYPGHHLQYSYALRNRRPLRHEADNTYSTEGWALYAEHWMARKGYFADPDGRLAQLQMRLWRTARVIIDPSIHTGAMSYDDAVGFFMSEVGLERSAAEAEVNRFTTWPTQAPSYIVGWQEIERMERELQRDLGARFDEKQFIEHLLDQGALPPALLRRAVRDSFGLGE
ncbi:MAG TPA: DUF885 domain-containing protein [Candidatus Elarobacter sp.]|nr:DUF885 domain-containing protein [Candidatus Elarobacter sp.]